MQFHGWLMQSRRKLVTMIKVSGTEDVADLHYLPLSIAPGLSIRLKIETYISFSIDYCNPHRQSRL